MGLDVKKGNNMFGDEDHDEKDCKGEPCPLHGNPVPYFVKTIFTCVIIGIIIFLFGR